MLRPPDILASGICFEPLAWIGQFESPEIGVEQMRQICAYLRGSGAAWQFRHSPTQNTWEPGKRNFRNRPCSCLFSTRSSTKFGKMKSWEDTVKTNKRIPANCSGFNYLKLDHHLPKWCFLVWLPSRAVSKTSLNPSQIMVGESELPELPLHAI